MIGRYGLSPQSLLLRRSAGNLLAEFPERSCIAPLRLEETTKRSNALLSIHLATAAIYKADEFGLLMMAKRARNTLAYSNWTATSGLTS